MDEEIKKLLEKNLELNEEIYHMVRDLKNYIFWQRIWSVFKVLIIVVPLIIGFIYLPPLIKDMFTGYQSLLGENANGLGGDLFKNGIGGYQDLLK